MARVLVIKQWQRFQHYKDRDPTWIKLYRDSLTSEVWVLGTDLSRLLQLASTLLAARYSNATPLDTVLIRKVLNLDCTDADLLAAIEHLERHDFLSIQEVEDTRKQPASAPLAPRYARGEEIRVEERRGDKTQNARAREDVSRETFRVTTKIKPLYPEGIYAGSEWILAERQISNRLDEGISEHDLVAAATEYGIQQTAKGSVGTQFVLSPAKFFDSTGRWRGPFPLPKTKAQTTQDANVSASLEWLRQQEAGNAA